MRSLVNLLGKVTKYVQHQWRRGIISDLTNEQQPKDSLLTKLGVVEGPAADATDAPQPWGLLCNPVMNLFPCNGSQEEWNWQGKTEVLGENPVPVPPCPLQIPYGLTQDRTRASAVSSRRLTPQTWHGFEWTLRGKLKCTGSLFYLTNNVTTDIPTSVGGHSAATVV
jgi:hypothetical protein